MNPRPIFGVYDERKGIYDYLMKDGNFVSRNIANRKEVLLVSEIQAQFLVKTLDNAVQEEYGCFGYFQMTC